MPRSDALRDRLTALVAELRHDSDVARDQRERYSADAFDRHADELDAILAAPDPAPAAATVKDSLTVHDVPTEVHDALTFAANVQTWYAKGTAPFQDAVDAWEAAYAAIRAALTPPPNPTPTDRIVVDQDQYDALTASINLWRETPGGHGYTVDMLADLRARLVVPEVAS